MVFRGRKPIKVKVFYNGKGTYRAMATDGKRDVWNCFGTTKESAKDMALFKLRKLQEETLSDMTKKS